MPRNHKLSYAVTSSKAESKNPEFWVCEVNVHLSSPFLHHSAGVA